MINKILLILTIVLHYVVFVAFILTSIGAFLNLKWYIALSIVALIVRVIFSRTECPLTTLENKFRVKLKMEESKGFLKDYILNPHKTVRRLYGRLKTRN